MNKKFISKVVSALLIIIVLSSQIIMPASVSAETQKTASFTLTVSDDDSVINRDETFTLVFAVGKDFNQVNGFNFSVSYSTAYLSYEQDSLAFYSGTLSDVTVNATGSVINIAWDSATPVSLADGQKLFYLRFRVNNAVATGSQTTISVNLNSMYSSSISSSGVSYIPFVFSVKPTATIVVGQEKKATEIVSELITNIGTVTLDDACKERIDAASDAYYSLPLENRTAVSNASDLFSAIKQYQALLDASTNIYADQIAQFRSAHADILGTDLLDLTLEDKEAVVSAYNTLVSLPLGAQASLYTERTKLMSLLTRIAELEVENDGDGSTSAGPTEDELAEAEAIIKEFDTANGESFEQFLADGIENINVDAAGSMINAYNSLFSNAMAEPGSTLEAYMIDMLEELYGEGVDNTVAAIEEYLAMITDPYYVRANKYKAQFASVLAMDPAGLQYSDRTDIMIAATVLEWLDAETIALLQTADAGYGNRSIYDIVMELYDAAMLLEEPDPEVITEYIEVPGEGADAEEIIEYITNTITKTKTNTRTKTNTKLIYKTAAGNYLVKLATRDIGAVVWVLLCLAALSSIIFVVLRIVYHNVSKVKKEEI